MADDTTCDQMMMDYSFGGGHINSNLRGNLPNDQRIRMKHMNAISNHYYLYSNNSNSNSNTNSNNNASNIIEPIGAGGFGHVYKTQIPFDNTIHNVAIKAIEFAEDNPKSESEKQKPSRRQVMKEANRVFVHPRLLYVMDSFEEDKTLYIVSPFYAGGSLEKNQVIEERSCLIILEQVLEALEVLHANDYIHR